jgi:predicted DNA-binding transcriptional regulator AlpA
MRGWRWHCHLSQIAGRHARDETLKPARSVRLELTASDALLLATILNAAADPNWEQQPIIRGTVPVLPDLDEDDTWLTTRQVAERLGVGQKTITGWTARGGPKACPFPKGTRINYRNYWPATVIDQWDSDWRKAGSKAGRSE